MVHPPHDRCLYDILEVPANATTAQITKQYHILTRSFHPDKQRHQQQQQQQQQHSQYKFHRLQDAYEVLSNDKTRLLYHRYGLIDPNLAAFLLLGPTAAAAATIPSPISPGATNTVYTQSLHQQQQQYHSQQEEHQEHKSASSSFDPLFDKLNPELLQLMGYDASLMEVIQHQQGVAREQNTDDDATSRSATAAAMTTMQTVIEDYRVRIIAAVLVEWIRPVVEGCCDVHRYRHAVTQDCDRWKYYPLGAQIIRCIGRSYRNEATDFLQRYREKTPSTSSSSSSSFFTAASSFGTHTKNTNTKLHTDLTIGLRKKWRTTKDLVEAATMTGRVVLAERSYEKQQQRHQQNKIDNRKQRQHRHLQLLPSTASSSSSIPSSSASGNNNERTAVTFVPPMNDYYYHGNDEYDENDRTETEHMEELLFEEEREHKELEQLKLQQTLLEVLQIEALWKVVKIDLDRIVRKACARYVVIVVTVIIKRNAIVGC